jgi:hypothetical protein
MPEDGQWFIKRFVAIACNIACVAAVVACVLLPHVGCQSVAKSPSVQLNIIQDSSIVLDSGHKEELLAIACTVSVGDGLTHSIRVDLFRIHATYPLPWEFRLRTMPSSSSVVELSDQDVAQLVGIAIRHLVEFVEDRDVRSDANELAPRSREYYVVVRPRLFLPRLHSDMVCDMRFRCANATLEDSIVTGGDHPYLQLNMLRIVGSNKLAQSIRRCMEANGIVVDYVQPRDDARFLNESIGESAFKVAAGADAGLEPDSYDILYKFTH